MTCRIHEIPQGVMYSQTSNLKLNSPAIKIYCAFVTRKAFRGDQVNILQQIARTCLRLRSSCSTRIPLTSAECGRSKRAKTVGSKVFPIAPIMLMMGRSRRITSLITPTSQTQMKYVKLMCMNSKSHKDLPIFEGEALGADKQQEYLEAGKDPEDLVSDREPEDLKAEEDPEDLSADKDPVDHSQEVLIF
jgi:hypothetical protein